MTIATPVIPSLTYSGVPYGGVGDVTPFTIRSGSSYLAILEDMRRWIRDTLVPFLNEELPLFASSWEENAQAIETALQSALDQQRTNVQTALTTQGQAVNTALTTQQQGINSALAAQQAAINAQLQETLVELAQSNVSISDQVFVQIINKTDSQGRTALDNLYRLTDSRIKDNISNTDITTKYLATLFAQKQAASKQNAITGWFHVDDYGAARDNSADTNDQIQSAINDANLIYQKTGVPTRVYFPSGTYQIGVRSFHQPSTNTDEACGVYLKDGVELYGPGANLRVKNGAYGNGAFFGIVRSVYEGISDAGIVGLCFDGNRFQQVNTNANSGNVLIEAKSNVYIRDVQSRDSNGNGIMVRGNAYGYFAENISITNCWVHHVTGVGIQASQFNGCKIIGNTVHDTSDNCIDVYGEYGNHSTTSHGINFQVNDNNCRASGLVGIFFETVAYGVAVGNRISNCAQGMRVNRINGEPTSIAIRSNGIYGCAIGIAFSGVMKAVSFVSNEVQGATDACVKFDGLQCAGVFGDNNFLNGQTDQIPLVLVTSYVSQISNCYFDGTTTERSSSPSYVSYAGATASCSFGAAHGPGF